MRLLVSFRTDIKQLNSNNISNNTDNAVMFLLSGIIVVWYHQSNGNNVSIINNYQIEQLCSSSVARTTLRKEVSVRPPRPIARSESSKVGSEKKEANHGEKLDLFLINVGPDFAKKCHFLPKTIHFLVIFVNISKVMETILIQYITKF